MSKLQMTQEELREIAEEHPDNEVLQSLLQRDGAEEEDDAIEEEVADAAEGVMAEEPVGTGWQHAIAMGLMAGLLWAVAMLGGVGGIVLIVHGLVNDKVWELVGGIALVGVGVAVGVCAKLFHDKVRYGEV